MASNLRLSISNDAGYSLNMWIYKEETDPVTGILKFATVGPQTPLADKAQKTSVDQGPMHGLPVSTPYMTKDFLETKRSQALRLETTYVYDFPEMFRMNLRDLWKEWRRKNNNSATKTAGASDVEMFFNCVELVLDNEGRRVVERKRYPGENDIAMVAWRMTFSMPGEIENR